MINKPQPNEYSPFAAGYVALASQHSDVVKLLTDLSESTVALFNSLRNKANFSYAPGKWTVKEVINHMTDTERVFAYRALCVARGEQQNLPGFEQDDFVANCDAAKRDYDDLIAEFKAVRLSSIYFFKSLSTTEADRIGNVNSYPTSVRALAHMIAGHELHHHNIFRDRYM
jgi:uncharacterized damage-inducible protein DinB